MSYDWTLMHYEWTHTSPDANGCSYSIGKRIYDGNWVDTFAYRVCNGNSEFVLHRRSGYNPWGSAPSG